MDDALCTCMLIKNLALKIYEAAQKEQLDNFSCFFIILLLFFFKIIFQKIVSRISSRVSNSLDPDQARHFVWPDQDPNYLQRLFANECSLVDKDKSVSDLFVCLNRKYCCANQE